MGAAMQGAGGKIALCVLLQGSKEQPRRFQAAARLRSTAAVASLPCSPCRSRVHASLPPLFVASMRAAAPACAACALLRSSRASLAALCAAALSPPAHATIWGTLWNIQGRLVGYYCS